MCFYYSLPEKAKNVATRYFRQLSLFEKTDMDPTDFDEKVIIKGFDQTPTNLIVTPKGLQMAKWGLVPFWSKPDYAEKVIKENRNVNAKMETVFTLPSFRMPIRRQRCLIPARGWFEYHYENGRVQHIYYISVKDLEIFSFAGIYDQWKKDSGNTLLSYSMVTTRANSLMAFIHNGGKNPNRMPVILSTEDEEKWLDPETSEEALKAMMQPFPTERMEAYPIRTEPKVFQGSEPHGRTVLSRL